MFICKILYKFGGETGAVIELHTFLGPSKKDPRAGEIAQGLITHITFSKDMSSVTLMEGGYPLHVTLAPGVGI